jgi:ubiquinone/menaquinone biosynthesis C-methylase UbiE
MGVQIPAFATISLDLNMNKVEPEFLRLIKEAESHAVCASATHLPFRSDRVEKLYWRAILEHLPREIARQGIKEGVRVLKSGGEAEVILPIITSHMRHYLIILFTQFPFSLVLIQLALRRARKYWGIEGVPHLTIINPWDLRPYFSKVVWRANYYRNTWFHYPWGRVTRKMVNQRFILIRCRK